MCCEMDWILVMVILVFSLSLLQRLMKFFVVMLLFVFFIIGQLLRFLSEVLKVVMFSLSVVSVFVMLRLCVLCKCMCRGVLGSCFCILVMMCCMRIGFLRLVELVKFSLLVLVLMKCCVSLMRCLLGSCFLNGQLKVIVMVVVIGILLLMVCVICFRLVIDLLIDMLMLCWLQVLEQQIIRCILLMFVLRVCFVLCRFGMSVVYCMLLWCVSCCMILLVLCICGMIFG